MCNRLFVAVCLFILYVLWSSGRIESMLLSLYAVALHIYGFQQQQGRVLGVVESVEIRPVGHNSLLRSDCGLSR